MATPKYKAGQIDEPEFIMTYEELEKNTWLDRDFFSFVDTRKENDGQSVVFKFVLIPEDIRTNIRERDRVGHIQPYPTRMSTS